MLSGGLQDVFDQRHGNRLLQRQRIVVKCVDHADQRWAMSRRQWVISQRSTSSGTFTRRICAWRRRAASLSASLMACTWNTSPQPSRVRRSSRSFRRCGGLASGSQQLAVAVPQGVEDVENSVIWSSGSSSSTWSICHAARLARSPAVFPPAHPDRWQPAPRHWHARPTVAADGSTTPAAPHR